MTGIEQTERLARCLKEIGDASRRRLAHLPTPFERLDRLRDALGPGCPVIYVKRDDCTGLATGGNKTRKLEFLIGEALAEGADAVVTVGAIQSNHVRQTAAAAAASGLLIEAVLMSAVDREDAAYRNCGNILLDRLIGANITYTTPEAVEDTVADVLARLRAAGRRPYLVPYGGSSVTGALGYVAAFHEIVADMGDSPATAIFHASSSGATQAGLCLGAESLSSSTRIVGVNVLKPLVDDLFVEIRRQVQEAATRLHLDYEGAVKRIEMLDGYLGAAYGEPSEEMLAALKLLARAEGLVLDPVYSGKAMAGLIGEIRAGRFSAEDRVIFLHTGGTAALHAYPELLLAGPDRDGQ